MNIQEENSAHYFQVQSEREQTLVIGFSVTSFRSCFEDPVPSLRWAVPVGGMN